MHRSMLSVSTDAEVVGHYISKCLTCTRLDERIKRQLPPTQAVIGPSAAQAQIAPATGVKRLGAQNEATGAVVIELLETDCLGSLGSQR